MWVRTAISHSDTGSQQAALGPCPSIVVPLHVLLCCARLVCVCRAGVLLVQDSISAWSEPHTVKNQLLFCEPKGL